MHRPFPWALPHPALFVSPLVTARFISQKENSFLNHLATGFGTSHLRLPGVLLLCCSVNAARSVRACGQGQAHAKRHLWDTAQQCVPCHTFPKGVAF